MCCDPVGSPEPYDHDCPDCGMGVDKDGDTLDACAYSHTECETCGWSPCDWSC